MFSKPSVCALGLILAVFCLTSTIVHSQTPQIQRREVPIPTLHFPEDRNVVEVPFEVDHGLMIIPLSVNGSRPLRYAFDSGASGAIHYNAAVVESLDLKVTGKMLVRGVGGGGTPAEVSVAENVTFNVGGIELSNGSLAIRPPGGPSGWAHDGVIGRPIFANLVVEVDWEKQVIRFYEPAKYKYSGSGTVLPLTFDEGGRPYTMASVTAGEKSIPVKLVVDSGASHSLSLNVGSNSEIKLPEGATKTVLGRGASGEVTGYTGRMKALEFGGQTFNDVPTTFPDSSLGVADLNGRQGNLGSGILRRFKVVYDYSRKQMIVEPNKFFHDPFGVPMQIAAASTPPTSTDRSATDDDAFARELNTYLEQATAGDSFSGAVLIAKDGRPVFKKAYGLANKNNNTPNNVDTKFDLGSMNKMFTAVAIAQLVEQGKLSFTDTVGKLLPDYPNKAVAEKVTVHQLLTHTSGMGSYFNEKFQANLKNLKTVADYLPLFADDPLAFEPGAKWQYSNSGFVVLGLIVEKVSGESYFDYVKKHIFKPAGMVNTDSYERDKDVPNLAIGYTKVGDNGRPDPSAPRRANSPMRPLKGSPAGGGYSTVDDLLRFGVALQNHKLLSEKYTKLVTTGKVDMGQGGRKYGYGFGEEVSNGRRIIGHNGGGPGVGANFAIFTELGYTAVILGNYDPPAMMPVVMKIQELLPTAAANSVRAKN